MPHRPLKAAAALAAAVAAAFGPAPPHAAAHAEPPQSPAVQAALQALRAQGLASDAPVLCSGNTWIVHNTIVAAVCIGKEEESVGGGIFIVAGSLGNRSRRAIEGGIALYMGPQPNQLVHSCEQNVPPNRIVTCTSKELHHTYPAIGVGKFTNISRGGSETIHSPAYDS
ncbi:hypothetical protein ABZ924_20430 [Streptomyces sp. NPDC046876]|uniref:hypothetical protein n=1 Tax=Streptomyces sp. NPDC046876 TaxID=3155616 RepID=UPI0033E990E4